MGLQRALPPSPKLFGQCLIETAHGAVAVKIGVLDGHVVTVAPEYEDCVRIAREAGVPAKDVFEQAVRMARRELDEE